jgi:hypothetical protein
MTATSDPCPTPPNTIVVETSGGLLLHPLPLPAGLSPEAWLAGLPMSPEVKAGARWTLAIARPRSDSFTPTQAWAPVATA